MIILSVIRAYNHGSWGSKASSNLPRSNSKSVLELVGNTDFNIPHSGVSPPNDEGWVSLPVLIVSFLAQGKHLKNKVTLQEMESLPKSPVNPKLEL